MNEKVFLHLRCVEVSTRENPLVRCMSKVAFSIRDWSPIPGQIVLVSTYDPTGAPHIAPKSRMQMVCFEPPVLMFSGNEGEASESNLRTSGCFGINLVDSSMAKKVLSCTQWEGKQGIEKTGFKIVDASMVLAPLVEDCRVNLECMLCGAEEMGTALIVYGEIVAASISEEIMAAKEMDKHKMLDPVLLLEKGIYTRIAKPAKLE